MSVFKGRGQRGPAARITKEKVKLKDAKGTIKRLLHYLNDKIVLLILVAVFSFFYTVINIIGTRYNGIVVDRYIAGSDIKGLAVICLVLAVMYLAGSLLSYAQSKMMIYVSQNTTFRLREDLFAKLHRLPVTYFETHASGDLMSRLTNDIDNISTALSQNLTRFFSGIINIVGMLLAMLLLSPRLTAVSLAMIPVMFLLTSLITKYTRRIYLRQQNQLGALNGYAEEMISGQKAVLLFNRQEKVRTKFAELNENLRKSAVLTSIGAGILAPLMNLLNNFTYLIVAVFGGYMVVQGNISEGIVFSFLLYMRNFSRPINELANLFTSIQGALAGAERVFEVMDEKEEADWPEAAELTETAGLISFENVDFSYEPGKPVLKDVSFTAKPGTVTAFVGKTGAGKTTIINLLTRFYDIDGGSIKIDGRDISAFTRDSLRRHIGMVLQDTFLFSESLKENIRYGCSGATDEEVIQAAKIAKAHGFIELLAEGYDTVLTDNGSNLSQGQRQLLAIARVILARPSILILDEATSSVDTRTELLIQEAFQTLMQGRTSFVIAHRLSTIKNADQIIVVHDGRLVEKGTHESLLQADGYYASLYKSQFVTGLSGNMDNS